MSSWRCSRVTEGDKGTWKAREIIKSILAEDHGVKGCQRLIAVYTAEENFDGIFSDVVHDVGSFDYVGGRLIINRTGLSLSNRTTRIVFLNKNTKGTDPKIDTTVSEEELPTRLIDEFLKLNHGLLPAIALHSIASIRETTHHLLSIFDAKLDPALVCHRSLLSDPRDSEEFVLDLISGELRSALSLNRIGQEHAGPDANKDWIAGKLSGDAFKLTDDIPIKKKEAFLMVEGGQIEFKKVQKNAANRWVDHAWAEKKEFRHKYISGKLPKKAVQGLIDSVSLEDIGKHLKSPKIVFLSHDNLTGVFARDAKMGAR